MKGVGNAVIPTFPMHRSYGLQWSLKRRYKHPSPTSINGYHTAKKLLSQSPAKRPTFAFTSESGYTLAFANRIAHSGLHAETGAVSDGGAITTLGAFCAVRKPCVARCQNGVLCRFGILAGRCSRRTQKAFGTAMRLCVSLSRRRRGPAGLRDPFSSVEIGICTSGAHGFPRVRGMGGITTLGALCVLLKYWTVACQSGSFAIFRGQVGVVPRTIPIFLRIHRIFCWQFQLQTLLRYGTISSTNWNFQISLCKQPLNLHHQLQFPDGC